MKKRLDVELVDRGLVQSRERAKVVIMEGLVYVNGQKSDKAGTPVKEDDRIEVRGETLRYVSRGGKKLEKAMQVFPVVLEGCTCMDIGASTGGFTDCMLQNGAVKVYAVDVGYGQLAWSLRTDERVVNLERTNIRYITEEQVPQPVDFISVDVSFISLTLVLPVAHRLLKDGAQMVCLVKPQFEAGKDRWAKKASCVIRRFTARSSARSSTALPSWDSGCGVWIFRPSRVPRATLSTCCFYKSRSRRRCRRRKRLQKSRLPVWWTVPTRVYREKGFH